MKIFFDTTAGQEIRLNDWADYVYILKEIFNLNFENPEENENIFYLDVTNFRKKYFSFLFFCGGFTYGMLCKICTLPKILQGDSCKRTPVKIADLKDT